ELDPLARVARAEWLRARVATLGRRARRDVAHRAEEAERAVARPHRGLAVDLEVLEPGIVDADAERAGPVLRLEGVLPERRRLEHVPVRVSRAVEGKAADLVADRRPARR